jgi:hypothetical protein
MATANEIMAAIEAQRYQKYREDLLARNMAYANPAWTQQVTRLDPVQEQAFLQWIQQNQVPFNPQDKYPDYDMRGFYTGLMNKDPNAVAGINEATQSLHYPDYWKTPYHESFSAESQWAKEGAPTWRENQLVSPKGEVIFEDKPEK